MSKKQHVDKKQHASRKQHVRNAQHTRHTVEKRGRTVCILCETERNGYPVIDDVVLLAIRAIKTKLNVQTGNKLVICSQCLPKYHQRRARFEKYLALHGVLALAALILAILLSPSIGGFFGGVAFALFIISLSLFTYFPRAEGVPEENTIKAKK